MKGGTSNAIQDLMNKYDYKCVIMIGDGATDMQARPPAKAFIGYEGIVERASANWSRLVY